jgi:hypothetical protein
VVPQLESSTFSFLNWLRLHGTALERRPDETEHGDDHSGEGHGVTDEWDGAVAHAGRIGGEVVGDVDHGSEKGEPEARAHEQREFSKGAAGPDEH